MDTNIHKQDNLFKFYPMYICLGVYYILYLIASPFIKLWNSGSTTLYNNVNKNIDTNNLRGAYMTEADKIAAENAKNGVNIHAPVKKEVKISDKLILQRENLINIF